jgi:hypothetical protein
MVCGCLAAINCSNCSRREFETQGGHRGPHSGKGRETVEVAMPVRLGTDWTAKLLDTSGRQERMLAPGETTRGVALCLETGHPTGCAIQGLGQHTPVVSSNHVLPFDRKRRSPPPLSLEIFAGAMLAGSNLTSPLRCSKPRTKAVAEPCSPPSPASPLQAPTVGRCAGMASAKVPSPG